MTSFILTTSHLNDTINVGKKGEIKMKNGKELIAKIKEVRKHSPYKYGIEYIDCLDDIIYILNNHDLPMKQLELLLRNNRENRNLPPITDVYRDSELLRIMLDVKMLVWDSETPDTELKVYWKEVELKVDYICSILSSFLSLELALMKYENEQSKGE